MKILNYIKKLIVVFYIKKLEQNKILHRRLCGVLLYIYNIYKMQIVILFRPLIT